jgi:hypothetical protein
MATLDSWWDENDKTRKVKWELRRKKQIRRKHKKLKEKEMR